MPAFVKTVTLGCKVNQYETQFIREGLIQLGYQQASEDDVAELCIVNTCTVTSTGVGLTGCRRLARRYARTPPIFFAEKGGGRWVNVPTNASATRSTSGRDGALTGPVPAWSRVSAVTVPVTS